MPGLKTDYYSPCQPGGQGLIKDNFQMEEQAGWNGLWCVGMVFVAEIFFSFFF